MARKIFTNIGGILTLKAAAAKSGRQVDEKDLSWTKNNTIVVDERGVILWIGKWERLPKEFNDGKKIDWDKREVIPAFVECHTHSIFAGERSSEFEMRNTGVSYQEIAAKGGGILSTVKATRSASEQDLLDSAQKRINRFVAQGVSTVEVKSGYGLKKASEEKMLRVANQLKKARILKTYLGAHAIPPEYKGKQGKKLYMDQILHRDLPDLVSKKLCDRVDIFVDSGYFDLEDASHLIERAKHFGLQICVHGDQLTRTGACKFAARNQVQSIEHAIELTAADRKVIANSDTTSVLLPTADIYIHAPYPKARELIDEGARVALATDFNPGSSPTQDLSFVGMLARLKMKMSLAETICAYTYNAAHALGMHSKIGSIEVGKQADLCVLDMSWKDLFYSVGHHEVFRTVRGGKMIYSKPAVLLDRQP